MATGFTRIGDLWSVRAPGRREGGAGASGAAGRNVTGCRWAR